MPIIQPFRGIRYNLAQVGSLSDVIAPPYDVIGPDLQNQLYKQHPANVIRLELNRDEPGDGPDSKYDRAARYFKTWQSENILQSENEPSFYVYQQTFDYAGQTFTRRGFMGRIRLVRFGEGSIHPHEETHSKAKEDRLKLTKACKANLSQIFGIYPDPENAAQQVLEDCIGTLPALQATDHLGVKHAMWVVSNAEAIRQACEIVADKPMFVADGHHRYETACNYRDWLIQTQGPLPENHPANYVLTMMVSTSDPGMIIMPTHRLFRGVPKMSSEELKERLSSCFTCNPLAEGADAASLVWKKVEGANDQGTMAMYSAVDERWSLISAKPEAHRRMAELEPNRSEDWRGLGVSILHRLVIGDLLGITDHPKPTYVHLVDEVVEGLHGGGDEPGEFPLATLVMPAGVDDIEAVSVYKERMPAKSTYFYPKLLSGLVFHSLI